MNDAIPRYIWVAGREILSNFGIHFPSQQTFLPTNICSVKLHILTVSEFCFRVFPVGRYYWKNSLAKLSDPHIMPTVYGPLPALVIWETVYTGMSKCKTLKIQSAPETAEWEVTAEQTIRALPCCCQRLEGSLAPSSRTRDALSASASLRYNTRLSVAKSRCSWCCGVLFVGRGLLSICY